MLVLTRNAGETLRIGDEIYQYIQHEKIQGR